MHWEDLTSQEIGALDRGRPVVLSIAAIEQHGPHLPLSTDATIGRCFLDRLEERLGEQVLILPQIKVCCSAHHIDFPGTLSVSHETFLAYAYEILSSVAHHGFRNILIVNSHGGNQAIGRVLVEKFGARHPQCQAALVTWWTMAGKELAAVRESAPFGLGHACEFETSLMLYAAPDSVRRELVRGWNYVPTLDWANGEMLMPSRGYLFRMIRDSSGGTGVLGDASAGTVEKGRRITEIVVDQLVHIIETLAASPARA